MTESTKRPLLASKYSSQHDRLTPPIYGEVFARRTRRAGGFTRREEHDSYAGAFERLLRDLKAGA